MKKIMATLGTAFVIASGTANLAQAQEETQEIDTIIVSNTCIKGRTNCYLVEAGATLYDETPVKLQFFAQTKTGAYLAATTFFKRKSLETSLALN